MGPEAACEITFEFDDFTLDVSRRLVRNGDRPISLRPKCFDVLRCLVEQAGRVVSKFELCEAAWPDANASDESLARCISEIRIALGNSGSKLIKTIPSRGYTVAVPVKFADRRKESNARRVPKDIPSLSVLPFSFEGEVSKFSFLGAGMTENLTAALSRVGGFLVVALQSWRVEPENSNLSTFGAELGVRYLLLGNVIVAGANLRVLVRLIEAESGQYLWSERYDCDVDDVFAIQDKIVFSIVGRLGPELLAAEFARIRRRPPQGLNAWECVIRALFHASQQSDPETRIALNYLESAIQLDGEFAQALGMKAWILVFRAFQGWAHMPDVLNEVQPLIARAMAINNSELWIYLAQGMVGYAIRDNNLSMSALSQAVELSPNSVNAHGLLGNAHSFGGRYEEAIRSIQTAMRLSSRDTYLSDFELYNAFAYFQGAQYETALQFALQANRLRPGHPYPLLLAASSAGHLRKKELARSLLGNIRQIVPSISSAWVDQSSPYILASDRGRLLFGLGQAGLS